MYAIRSYYAQFDPRVDWLLELLKSARQEKVLVICSEAATALTLENALRTREGIRGTVFHVITSYSIHYTKLYD